MKLSYYAGLGVTDLRGNVTDEKMHTPMFQDGLFLWDISYTVTGTSNQPVDDNSVKAHFRQVVKGTPAVYAVPDLAV